MLLEFVKKTYWMWTTKRQWNFQLFFSWNTLIFVHSKMIPLFNFFGMRCFSSNQNVWYILFWPSKRGLGKSDLSGNIADLCISSQSSAIYATARINQYKIRFHFFMGRCHCKLHLLKALKTSVHYFWCHSHSPSVKSTIIS